MTAWERRGKKKDTRVSIGGAIPIGRHAKKQGSVPPRHAEGGHRMRRSAPAQRNARQLDRMRRCTIDLADPDLRNRPTRHPRRAASRMIQRGTTAVGRTSRAHRVRTQPEHRTHVMHRTTPSRPDRSWQSRGCVTQVRACDTRHRHTTRDECARGNHHRDSAIANFQIVVYGEHSTRRSAACAE